uniref:Uncharacterized protein n=1 Tax=Leersia perrieri TaxID=77586 RepID=A0A0D9UXL4_9ORYZ
MPTRLNGRTGSSQFARRLPLPLLAPISSIAVARRVGQEERRPAASAASSIAVAAGSDQFCHCQGCLGKYTLLQDEENPRLAMFERRLPCFGCGIGWSSFLVPVDLRLFTAANTTIKTPESALVLLHQRLRLVFLFTISPEHNSTLLVYNNYLKLESICGEQNYFLKRSP